jgi:hypothetical protein
MEAPLNDMLRPVGFVSICSGAGVSGANLPVVSDHTGFNFTSAEQFDRQRSPEKRPILLLQMRQGLLRQFREVFLKVLRLKKQ